MKGDVLTYQWDEIKDLDWSNALHLDVRTKAEFGLGTIDGAINIPLDELRERVDELPADKSIYVFCQVGLRGYIAARMLMGKGYKSVKNLNGGYLVYNTVMQDRLATEHANTVSARKSEEMSGFDAKTVKGGASCVETTECGKPVDI